MKSIVAKFGGSSVVNFDAIVRCANIIKSHPHTRIVVVSAQAGITDCLLKLSRAAIDCHATTTLLQDIDTIIRPILEQFNQANLSALIEEQLSNLSVLATMLQKAYSAQLADELLSYGEKMSAHMMTAALSRIGLNACYIKATSLIRTNSEYGHAKPHIALTAQQTQAALIDFNNDTILVTEGFVGANQQKLTTTLGRGGSDYSAALLAEAISAQTLQIWTDVAGIYQVDPKLASTSKKINIMSFNEASELATFGAKVLHPASLWPAIRQNINVFVGSSIEPEAGGTWIHKTLSGNLPIVRALSLRKAQTLLTVKSLDMLHAPGFLVKIFTVLAKHNISIDLVTTSEVSVAMTLDKTASQVYGETLLSDEVLLELQTIGQVEVNIEQNLALVAIIGNQLQATSGISGPLFSLLESFNVRLICHGASENNVCFLVQEEDAGTIIKILYTHFFNVNGRAQ
ncbi:MAG: lysine-sensitive aspartokinase 3 [Pseudomonadota bacterium]